MSDTIWKMRSRNGWTYYEPDEMDRLVASLTEDVILFEHNRRASGSQRRRFRAWLMRNQKNPHSREAEIEVGLTGYTVEPQVFKYLNGEWVEVEWELVEPTVHLS